MFLSYKSLKLKLRVFLGGHIIAMVSYCATKFNATYLKMIGQIFDATSWHQPKKKTNQIAGLLHSPLGKNKS